MALPKVGTPEYVNFLLSPDTPLDFHIHVGDPEKIATERIGAVKWMLIARSKVLRVMLLESKMQEKSDFKIKDLDPYTFKNFLTYLYGHDNTTSLPFEDSIKLLNAAEKYDVEDLKNSLSSQILDRVSTENVFTVLRHPEICEQVAPVWAATTKIIQYRTEDVFANDQFKDLSLEAMLFILQQDSLSVTEIDLWRAALRWATYKGEMQHESVTSEVLRELVLPLLKHIRLCTLSLEQFTFEVLLSNILTNEEMRCIIMSLKEQQRMDSLSSISNEIDKRNFVSDMQIYKNAGIGSLCFYKATTFWLLTLSSSIELCSIVSVCSPRDGPQPNTQFMVPKPVQDTTYQCQGEVKISRITDYDNNTSTEPPVTVSFNETVAYEEDFEIPVRQDNQSVVLRPNNKYAVEINFTSDHKVYKFHEKPGHEVTRSFEIAYHLLPGHNTVYGSHMKAFKYRVSSDTCQQVT